MIRGYGLLPDTGGAGAFRGGCGVYRSHHLEAPTSLYLWFERSVTPAWGLFGGGDAVGPNVVVNPGREDERHMVYGVVLGARFEVDEEATARAREARRS